MNKFSFSHSVFYQFGELSAVFMKFENCRMQSLSVWKSLKFVVWVNDPEVEALSKHFEEKKIMLVTFSPFPTMFSILSEPESIMLIFTVICRLQMLSVWSRPKNCHLVELIPLVSSNPLPNENFSTGPNRKHLQTTK